MLKHYLNKNVVLLDSGPDSSEMLKHYLNKNVVLLDSGPDSSDITRTYPVSGKYT
jgi:MinD-like ATPase involved in chromosome partitioning or flagellar assembly